MFAVISDLPTEPMSQGHGTETVEAVYNYQPMKGVEADLQPYYSGVQANFWTEWVVDSSVLEYLMLPRLAAVAEAGWQYFRGVLHSKTPVVVVGWQVSWPYNLLVVYRNKSVNL